MDLEQYCPSKVIAAEKAISKIKCGSRVFLGTGCGEPQHLIRTMAGDLNLQDIMIYQMLSFTLADFVQDPSFLSRFSLKLFFISNDMRRAAFEGKIDYVPAYLSQIPRLFQSQHIGLDVALIQVSPPDKFRVLQFRHIRGYYPIRNGECRDRYCPVNPKMPRTWGDSFVHVDEIDHFVLYEEPLIEVLPSNKDEKISRRVAHYVSQLVEDEATLQIGFGHLPYSILQYLDTKKDLGIHTQLITDGLIPPIKKGVITNKKKSLLPGRVVASLCMGSEEIYRFVDNNPAFYFKSSEFVSDPTEIARNDNVISISSAPEVDLTGQVNSDSLGNMFYSGIGDQVDFLRGSAMSKNGFSIIALPSTAYNGTVSRIVPQLSEGAGVATTRADVNFIVTEYGIAELNGRSIYQRVMDLAQIAHPKFRKELIDEAKKRHYIFADQLPPPTQDLLFLEDYKNKYMLPNGKIVNFRPLLPSDEFEYRNFFYSLQEETIYFRFFYKMKLFSHEVVQEQWASVDYRKNMSMIGLVQKEGHQEVMAIGSYADMGGKSAEIAFVVREDFQSMGVSTQLLKILEKIAKENAFQRFCATVLRENAAMIKVFKKRYPNVKAAIGGGSEVSLTMEFDDKGIE